MEARAPYSRPLISGYDRLTTTFSWVLNKYEPAHIGQKIGEAAWTMRVSNTGPSPIVRAGRALAEIAPTPAPLPKSSPRHLRLVK